MAVTLTITRNTHTETVSTFEEFCTAALTGTYATGGFTWTPSAIKGGLGTSPVPAPVGSFLTSDFYPGSGASYQTTFNGTTATTKIFNGGTELANGTAVPDASMTLVVVKRKA